MESTQMPLRCLSLSGGGTRGLIPALILCKLEEITCKPISELFDVIVGSSVGSLIATILTVPDENGKPKYSAKQCLDIFLVEGPVVFSNSMWRRLYSVYGLYGPQYCPKNRDDRFKAWIGETKLSQTLVDLIVPTYEMASRQPVFFKSRKARLSSEHDKTLLDVVKGASAAPMIFAPYDMENDIGLYQDPLFAKNPTLYVIAEGIKHYNAKLDNMIVLSLGTGIQSKIADKKKIPRGGAPFLAQVADNAINGNTFSTIYIAEQLLAEKSRLLHVDMPIDPVHMTIADTSKEHFDYLTSQAENWLRENDAKLRQFANLLIDKSE